LPQTRDGFEIIVNEHGDIVTPLQLSTPMFRLEVKNLRIDGTKNDAPSCRLEKALLQGSRLHYRCQSSHGQAVGTLKCLEAESALVCSHNSLERNTSLRIREAEEGELECQLERPASTTTAMIMVKELEDSFHFVPMLRSIQEIPVLVEQVLGPSLSEWKKFLLVASFCLLVVLILARGVCRRH